MLSLKPGNSVKLNENITDIHMPINAEWKSKNSHNLKEAHNLWSQSSIPKLPQKSPADVKSISLSQLGSVQGRFSMAAWRLLPLTKACFQDWSFPLYLGGWQVNRYKNSYLDDKWLTMHKLLAQKLFIPNTSFPLGSLEFCYLLGWGSLCDQIPKKLWVLSLWYVTTTCNWRNLVHSCVTTWEDSAALSLNFTHSFTFCIFSLYPFRCKLFYIAIATHGCRTGDWSSWLGLGTCL